MSGENGKLEEKLKKVQELDVGESFSLDSLRPLIEGLAIRRTHETFKAATNNSTKPITEILPDGHSESFTVGIPGSSINYHRFDYAKESGEFTYRGRMVGS